MVLPPPALRTARWRAPRRCGGAAGRPVTCWRGAAVRVLATLAVLVAALPSSAAVGTAAASPPPPTDMGLLVARLGRLEAEVRAQARETREARADARALERRVAELEAERRGERDATRGVSWQYEHETKGGTFRRAQAASQDNTTVVHLHRASVVSLGGPGMGTSPDYNEGHRRAQTAGVCGNLAARINAVNVECCNEPSEDCSSGAPATCNAGCAGVFLPFWADCSAQLPSSASFLPVVARCQAVALEGGSAGGDGAGSGSLVHEFNLVCAGGAVDNCVPACSAALRGDLLLMNLNGEDSKYSCELHHGLHSWVGAATDGGYLGSDARAFVSAVLSGAAGYYALALVGDAGVGTDLMIRPGQNVHISGSTSSATTWGTGTFSVSQLGNLTLSRLIMSAVVNVRPGGYVTIQNCVFHGSNSVVSGAVSRDAAGTYTVVPSNFAWGFPTWAGTNYILVQLPAISFTHTINLGRHNLGLVNAPVYSELCTTAAFQPVASGVLNQQSPSDYCSECIIGPAPSRVSQDHEFDVLKQSTGWSDLVLFTRCPPGRCNWSPDNVAYDGSIDGGVVNSRTCGGGCYNKRNYENTWVQPLHPVCGRAIVQNSGRRLQVQSTQSTSNATSNVLELY
jgi:hypothetical protein